MRWTSRGTSRSVGLLALALLGGCEDQLPTASGEDRFPGGATPTTLEVVLPSEAFLLSDTVFDDYTSPRDAGYLLVAEDFGGALDAHALARPIGFPDSVTFTVGGVSRTEASFSYAAGTVTATVDNDASASSGPARLQLWTVTQRWDSATVTWDTAGVFAGGVERWVTPGGTVGRLLAEATWTPGDTAAVDTLTWSVDSLGVAELARDGAHGLLVRSATPGSRLQLGRLSLATALRPTARPDTAIAQTIAAGTQTFVYTPAPPARGTSYRIGGATAARTVVGIALDQQVAGCAAGAGCGTIPLREVTLNRAVLVLRPEAVAAGFRPLGPSTLVVRRVFEPGLGRLAPLGQAFSSDTVSATAFLNPGGGEVEVDLTAAIATALAADTVASSPTHGQATFALLGDALAEQFGFLSFADRPRLRLVYTLPLRPQLP